MTGTDVATYARERPGMSAFVFADTVVYHAYSTSRADWTVYGAGTGGSIAHLQGRDEKGYWWHRHDEYNKG